MFDLKDAGFKDPILVAGTDGVGTKLLIANAANKHDTIGIDLVAMCVNDLVVQGAEPLFFLDYFATGKLEIEAAIEVVSGIAEGCRQAGCVLNGGETAEMPGLYSAGEYDLGGFCVGAVERDQVLTGQDVGEGDILLGLPSDGLHSNGFSLVRKVIETAGLDYSDPAPFDSKLTLAEATLVPTRIYVKSCLSAIKAGGVHALAHITGGGLTENIPRVLPDGLGVDIDASQWTLPPLFNWLQKAGGIAKDEMARTFNCGIGMVVVVAVDQIEAVEQAFADANQPSVRIGQVKTVAESEAQVSINNRGEEWGV